jgi:hypothetical protein
MLMGHLFVVWLKQKTKEQTSELHEIFQLEHGRCTISKSDIVSHCLLLMLVFQGAGVESVSGRNSIVILSCQQRRCGLLFTKAFLYVDETATTCCFSASSN